MLSTGSPISGNEGVAAAPRRHADPSFSRYLMHVRAPRLVSATAPTGEPVTHPLVARSSAAPHAASHRVPSPGWCWVRLVLTLITVMARRQARRRLGMPGPD